MSRTFSVWADRIYISNLNSVHLNLLLQCKQKNPINSRRCQCWHDFFITSFKVVIKWACSVQCTHSVQRSLKNYAIEFFFQSMLILSPIQPILKKKIISFQSALYIVDSLVILLLTCTINNCLTLFSSIYKLVIRFQDFHVTITFKNVKSICLKVYQICFLLKYSQ